MTLIEAEAEFDVVGTPLTKPDGLPKTTGTARYADDLKLPRMAFCRLLRATRPHARIISIDTSRARELKGVFGVITGADLPVKYGVLPVGQDEEALCSDKVRYIGDAVAAVAAVDEETADRALDLIDVVYDELPTYLTIEEGLTKPGEPIHEGKFGNAHRAAALEFGDVDTALAEADHVFEDSYFFQGNTHLPLEQHACVAEWQPAGKLTLWTSTQSPHYVHKELAKALGLREDQVRVIAPPVGGGFGGKLELFQHEAAAARLAMLTGRPIKAALNREEVFYCHRGRHPVLMWLKTGWSRDGRLLGMDFQSFVDGGAYMSYGAASLYYTGALQAVCERVPAYRWQGVRVLTNKPPCGPKRGHGTPQPRYALECHFDAVAERLGMPVLELRRKNFLKPNSKTVNHLRITSNGLRQCVDIVTHASQFEQRNGKLPFGKGIGFAVGAYLCGAGLPLYWNDMPHSSVDIRLDRSGVVTVSCGQIDIGQGSNSMLVTVVAEALGARPEQINIVSADTELTPIDLGSYSSRVTFMAGNAAISAATQLRNRLIAAAADELDVPPDELVLRRGTLARRDGFNQGPPLSFPELVKLAESRNGALTATGSYKPPHLAGPFKGSGVGPSPAYSYSAAVAEVDVDPDTGWVTVERIWLAHDIGRALNPVLVEGQIEGSIYMALGEVLMEEQEFRGERGPRVLGVHRVPSMLEYKSPTTFETPEIHTFLVETIDPEGPFGAKEVGQGPLLPVIPAVANAVHDAVGVRIDETPITPEKVLRALEARAERKPARFGPTRLPTYAFPRINRVAPPWGSPESRRVMLRLPEFRYLAPRTLDEATSLLAEHGPRAMVVAGGTDLYPNMKRRQQEPTVLIGLRSLAELRGVQPVDGVVRIGATSTLDAVASDQRVREHLPALAAAAALVSTPHLRRMGTLGGNLCLDTRCTYYDQNYHWRKSIDFCMKKDGAICWVAPNSRRCWAVSSSDTAPVAVALRARLTLSSASGERTVEAVDFFRDDGIEYLSRRADEILSGIDVPLHPGWRMTYQKLRRRGSFDFPILGVAAAAKLSDGAVEDVRLVLGAVGSSPVDQSKLAQPLIGARPTREAIQAVAAEAYKGARPLDNTDLNYAWRKKMARVYVERALAHVCELDLND